MMEWVCQIDFINFEFISLLADLCVIFLFIRDYKQRRIIVAIESLKIKTVIKENLSVLTEDPRRRVLLVDISKPDYEQKVSFVDIYEKGVWLGIHDCCYITKTDSGFKEVISSEVSSQAELLSLVSYLPFEEIISFEESYDQQENYPAFYLRPYYKYKKEVYCRIIHSPLGNSRRVCDEVVDYNDVQHINCRTNFIKNITKRYYRIKRDLMRLIF